MGVAVFASSAKLLIVLVLHARLFLNSVVVRSANELEVIEYSLDEVSSHSLNLIIVELNESVAIAVSALLRVRRCIDLDIDRVPVLTISIPGLVLKNCHSFG